ncbi:MAG: hypothetical protein CVU39_04675 [Chloroflexi bacterium HGW-Chloroflexi-10]|nr:MAG: hypothetical protein CVU39_04675 [Chloroflexi bacterium HGW-Chloroflexi-10]
MANLSAIQVILFDLGDTLLYFDGDWNDVKIRSSKALWNSLKALGYQLEPDRFIYSFSTRMREYYQERENTLVEYTSARVLSEVLQLTGYAAPPIEIVQAALNSMYAISQQHWKREEDALSTLEWLRQHGFRIGLISNASDRNDVHTLLQKSDLNQYLETIIISSEFGLRKPHPAIFLKAMNYFSAEPDQCLMVGDKLSMDVVGAKQLGMQSAWISRRSSASHAEKYAHISPDIMLKTLEELTQILPDSKNK